MSEANLVAPATDSASQAWNAALAVIAAAEPAVAGAIRAELADQRAALKLIASENYASPAVLLAMGNWLSDKYAEGTDRPTDVRRLPERRHRRAACR